MAVEAIKPYGQQGSKHEQVEAMFDNIAPTYDCLNHVLSLGIDRLWRRSAIKKIRTQSLSRTPFGSPVIGGQESRGGELRMLDVATGTGDFAILAAQKLNANRVVGIDISDGMMAIGREKVEKLGLSDTIIFQHEDCEHLSFADGTFDVVISAFALRNFEHLGACLREMRRVLKPQGSIVVIDLCAPRRAPMRQVFWFYQHVIMPIVGTLFSHDRQAYRYLPRTMEAVSQGDEMAAKFREAGFTDVEYEYLTFDMCCLYSAKR
ncbi:MAG: bifunctional demethylmenaquinone methyltransferase/2-methoxy-6-polyprenyl-1,4-benzoquinol methylase UbiE [Bacteroidaceae bacterium]|nr:bifunctional demethylmenaquinone methyltransferase/2-methoxy-6-polyprenyl-1,4-benzoquinol methylase UbiE [Bacteroidaceae bacterium]